LVEGGEVTDNGWEGRFISLLAEITKNDPDTTNPSWLMNRFTLEKWLLGVALR
jgi:hypothetical protein